MSISNNRIGLHYFPDTLHYADQDLQKWLPELESLNISWLTVLAPTERAIPERFISGVIQAGIQPVLHFPLQINRIPQKRELAFLFDNYARWGVKQIALFDRPNLRRAWSMTAWSQSDPVEDFLDIFIPIADTICTAGLTPIFPPLEPGGDYWDTTFLQLALRGLKRRNQSKILDHLAVGAYAWSFGRSLDWGAGGPESWPESQPYYTPQGSQDHIGINISDWYQAVSQSELGMEKSVFILRAGSNFQNFSDHPGSSIDFGAEIPDHDHAESIVDILKYFSNATLPGIERRFFSRPTGSPHAIQNDMDLQTEPQVGQQVACVNFWLLTTQDGNPHAPSAWYKNDGQPNLIARMIKQYLLKMNKLGALQQDTIPSGHLIEHYLLMPVYAWGMADSDLKAVQPFLQAHHPTIGTSVQEASLASRVTIFGEAEYLKHDAVSILINAGCQVNHLNQDGIVLAI